MLLHLVQGGLAQPRGNFLERAKRRRARKSAARDCQSKPVSKVRRWARAPVCKTAAANSESGAQHNSQRRNPSEDPPDEVESLWGESLGGESLPESPEAESEGDGEGEDAREVPPELESDLGLPELPSASELPESALTGEVLPSSGLGPLSSASLPKPGEQPEAVPASGSERRSLEPPAKAGLLVPAVAADLGESPPQSEELPGFSPGAPSEKECWEALPSESEPAIGGNRGRGLMASGGGLEPKRRS